MDNSSIFIIGIIVTVLFVFGIFYTVKEFKEMYSGEEQDVPRSHKIDVDG